MRGTRGLALLLCWALLCNPTGTFVTQFNRDCVYGDGTKEVGFYYYVVFNKQVMLQYDPNEKLFLPYPSYLSQVHEAVINITTFLNTKPGFLDKIQKKQLQCQTNREKYWGSTVLRTVSPKVQIAATESWSKTKTWNLVCYVFEFYPAAVNVTWLKNGYPITDNLSEVLPNGDWNYQTQLRVDVTPQSGDSYTCSVEHASRQEPYQENWEPGLTVRQKVKISVSVVVLALGLIFLITGLICWMKSRHGYTLIPGYSYPEVS
uniref:HLA class II histocompatibility antigen, DM beta chain n=1 Tax=Geotrypetes seraphini TaxID=260995 RepID=A0A6P8Q168_GEOSA|nr:HLA class II histocompatibility antigen, DM beta chain [Geotrypetes seraphini]